MFSSLDKIDIVLEGKDGRTRYVQTDHRTAQEVEAQAASSTQMDLVRVLNPIRAPSAGGQPPLVERCPGYRPMGSLPFALETSFRGGAATINPLGKAIKRFENGEGDSVAALIESATRAA